MENAPLANNDTGRHAKSRESSPSNWVPVCSPDGINITVYEPSDEAEREQVRTFSRRVETFKGNKWNKKLTKSVTTNPEKMALVGWFCTASDSAKCFACFKDLEGWEPEDDPNQEHDKHCKTCPLTVLNIISARPRDLREQIRLDTAIEFYRKKLATTRSWDKAIEWHRQQAVDMKKTLANLATEKPRPFSQDESML